MGMRSEEMTGSQSLGGVIRHLRKSRGMTRKELAALIGNCTEKTISQYENGTRPMEVEMYFSLVEALRVTPNELAPKHLLENAASGLGDYARLSGSNQRMIDQFIGVVLKKQTADGDYADAAESENSGAEPEKAAE